MSGILNIGTRALMANQVALQTAGNNIANVNTPGYSRQSVVLQNVAGQFTGGGYIGSGVDVQTILRNHSDFLTRQAALTSSVSASDTARSDQLTQLENIFQGGTTGLGASVSNMLNSFSDVASAPTDLTARTVALTGADEMAARFRAASSSMNDLQQGVSSQLKDSVAAVNNLASQIASANEQIARAQGSGQPPNDLLDQRDQLIKNLNQYVQTTNIPADDGSVGIFLAGSQPLVLGNTASPISMGQDAFNDPAKAKLTTQSGVVLEESMLGGGQIAGLLKFQNTDLVEAKNLLGRMALAIGTATNDQNKLGIDLNGAVGGNLFTLSALPDGLKATTNTGSATLQVAVQPPPNSGTTALAASNYEVSFTSATAGNITRLSDGVTISFPQVPAPAAPILASIDGLNITASAGAVAGDSFLITPFSAVSSTIATAFSSPSALAMASPVAASAGAANQGTLAVTSLAARSNPLPATLASPITLTFTSAGAYTRSDTGATSYSYTPGQAIESDIASPGSTGWSLNLSGSPVAGDSFKVGSATTIQPTADPKLNSGNAEAMMALRDVKMFDGAALTDGYASAMAQIGVRVQSATSTAAVSKSIATNIETARAGVAGVNLDEEAAKLLQYQQAYQASAKMLQIAQSVFTSLMSAFP
jgi:flagellar hook-associated protein 1 FlgK